ncbi:MAG: hypothetical protein AABW80_02965 [Nanoarchaeota archaeon]
MEKISSKEFRENIAKDEIGLFDKFGHCYIAIKLLVDFIQVLEKNEKDYEDQFTISIINSLRDSHPSDKLTHYICLEAYSFYEVLKEMRKYNNSLPDLPSYFEELKNVRHKVVAHRDYRRELPLVEDVFILLSKLTKKANIKKIIEDVEQNFNLVRNKLSK